MRPHKYRAWDKKEKKMSLNYDLSVIPDRLRTSKDLELLEYIGRKDKKGVEIYEGDILKNQFGDIDEVFWHEDVAAWAVSFGHTWGEIDPEYNKVEVIGNKFENKEILK